MPLVWAGIRRKLSRSILILAQVIIAFALFGVLQGLVSAVNYAISSTHADRLYVGSNLNLGFQLPIAMVEWLKTVPGVVEVAPRFGFGGAYQRPEQVVPGIATDVDGFLAIYPENKVDPAQLLAMRQIQDGAIVGIGTIHQYGWKVGQRVTLQFPPEMKRTDGTNDWTFDIVGTWVDREGASEDDSQFLITHYRYLNESLPAGPLRNTMDLAVLRIADPKSALAIEQSIDAHYANSSNETLTQSESEMVQQAIAEFGDIYSVANRIVAATFFVLLFATGALMMQSIRERTPELAVLKTVGFSDRSVMMLIFAETIVLCVVGAGIGLLLGLRLLVVAPSYLGTLTVPRVIYPIAFACALALALATGAVAGWRGLRLRVVDALVSR